MEELDELQEVVELGDEEKMKDEFGDVVFSMINYARFLNIDPEDALARTNNKFQRRFNLMENQLTKDGNMLTDFNLQQMAEVWNEIKRNEK